MVSQVYAFAADTNACLCIQVQLPGFCPIRVYELFRYFGVLLRDPTLRRLCEAGLYKLSSRPKLTAGFSPGTKGLARLLKKYTVWLKRRLRRRFGIRTRSRGCGRR